MVAIYIYIYTYTYVCIMYIYIYIHVRIYIRGGVKTYTIFLGDEPPDPCLGKNTKSATLSTLR